jgi:oligopeptide/dipeptide ABC transporter ATP-binding protein
LLSAVPLPRLSVPNQRIGNEAEKNLPSHGNGKRERIILKGDIPTPLNKPSGCGFRTRCPIARPECSESVPPLELKRENHFAACILVNRI